MRVVANAISNGNFAPIWNFTSTVFTTYYFNIFSYNYSNNPNLGTSFLLLGFCNYIVISKKSYLGSKERFTWLGFRVSKSKQDASGSRKGLMMDGARVWTQKRSHDPGKRENEGEKERVKQKRRNCIQSQDFKSTISQELLSNYFLSTCSNDVRTSHEGTTTP